MGIEFKPVRDVAVSGFAADADPNLTPPDAAQVFDCPGQIGGQSQDRNVRGHAVKFVYLDSAGDYVEGGTVDFTAWYRDESHGGFWTALASETGAAANLSFPSRVVGVMWVQVTALGAPVGAATCRIAFAPRTSV